ncbi:MAG: Hpt domain-containing protein [Proteobacteria bacterium]|nr:MAG: Hpt domain-containing protein [Pseudomonadota bacterium]
MKTYYRSSIFQDVSKFSLRISGASVSPSSSRLFMRVWPNRIWITVSSGSNAFSMNRILSSIACLDPGTRKSRLCISQGWPFPNLVVAAGCCEKVFVMVKERKDPTLDTPAPPLKAVAGSEILNGDILTTLLSLDNYKGLFLAELIDIYTSTLPPLCEEIVQALNDQKYKDMSRLAHKAKGMSLSLGTNRLVALFEQIESGDSQDVVRPEGKIVEKLQEELAITSQELRKEWYLRKDFAKRRRRG